MNIIKREEKNFDPFQELVNNRLLGLTAFSRSGFPAIDISEDKDNITLGLPFELRCPVDVVSLQA